MSYEGYHQILCVNGHLFEFDCYSQNNPTRGSAGDWKCPVCGTPMAWWNSVDQTNCCSCYKEEGPTEKLCSYGLSRKEIEDGCQFYGRGHVKLEVKEAARKCKCDKCGHIRTSGAETYHIPKTTGHRCPF